MAQLIEYLLSKWEDPSLDSQHTGFINHGTVATQSCDPRAKKAEQEGPLTKKMNYRFLETHRCRKFEEAIDKGMSTTSGLNT